MVWTWAWSAMKTCYAPSEMRELIVDVYPYYREWNPNGPLLALMPPSLVSWEMQILHQVHTERHTKLGGDKNLPGVAGGCRTCCLVPPATADGVCSKCPSVQENLFLPFSTLAAFRMEAAVTACHGGKVAQKHLLLLHEEQCHQSAKWSSQSAGQTFGLTPDENQCNFKGQTCLAADHSGPSLNGWQVVLMHAPSMFAVMWAWAFDNFHLWLFYKSYVQNPSCQFLCFQIYGGTSLCSNNNAGK